MTERVWAGGDEIKGLMELEQNMAELAKPQSQL